MVSHSAGEVLRLAGKGHRAVRRPSIIQGTDADRVARGDQAVFLRVIEDQRELRVQHAEHVHAVLAVQRQQDLAVRVARKGILFLQPLADRAEAVQLAVADHEAAVQLERLHARLGQAHDGQAMKAQIAAGQLHQPAHVRPAGNRPVKRLAQRAFGNRLGLNAENGTHTKSTSVNYAAIVLSFQDEGRSPWCHLICFFTGFCQTLAAVTGRTRRTYWRGEGMPRKAPAAAW